MPRKRSFSLAAHRAAVSKFDDPARPPIESMEIVYHKVLEAIYFPWSRGGQPPPAPPATKTLQAIGYSSQNGLVSLAMRLNGAFAPWRIDVSANRGDVSLASTVQ